MEKYVPKALLISNSNIQTLIMIFGIIFDPKRVSSVEVVYGYFVNFDAFLLMNFSHIGRFPLWAGLGEFHFNIFSWSKPCFQSPDTQILRDLAWSGQTIDICESTKDHILQMLNWKSQLLGRESPRRQWNSVWDTKATITKVKQLRALTVLGWVTA